MDDDRKQNNTLRNIVCAILCILVAAVLVFMYDTNRQQEKAQTAALQALQDELQPYEAELQELRAELSELEAGVSYTSAEADIMVGFALSGMSDLSYIGEKAEAYGFAPVLVIDCTMEMEDIEAIVDAADKDWEIMLYASDFSEESNENVVVVMDYLESIGREHTGVFFLRSDYSSARNIQLLIEDGFIGYTGYSDSPTAGQTEDGLIYFDYSYLTASGTTITSRLASLYSSKSTIIVAFDMASINSGSLSETYVVSLFDTLQNYAEKEDCSFCTAADAVQELSEVNSIEAANQEAYEEQAAEIQERMEELKETIAQIYEKAEY
ncbi:MAG: hypothetical protein LUG61_13105 [Lachnospiraceae bacterium]|nr:hypothetical protein [Lachnospiraceae bacterium]